MERLLIIDGSSLLTTAYYGNLPPEIKFNKDHEKDHLYYHKILHSPGGIYTNATYSFMTRLEKILEIQKPSHLAVSFDMTRNTFRRKIFPDYKMNRKDTPEPLKMQREYLPNMLMEMGIMTFWSPDFEGDDIIGSLTEKFKKDINISILSGDHDMMQLVKPGVQLWYMTHSGQKAKDMFFAYTQGSTDFSLESYHLPEGVFPFSPESVVWDKGVRPEQIPDLKGLSGDSSDNIPGVKGISEEKASILIRKYGSVEQLFAFIKAHDEKEIKTIWKDELGMVRAPVKALIGADAEKNAVLSKKLATIITWLQFPVTLDQLRVNFDPVKRREKYEELGFQSLLKKEVLHGRNEGHAFRRGGTFGKDQVSG